MRKITAFSIAIALVAVGTLAATWAVTATRAQGQGDFFGARIHPLEMMVTARDLPAQQFDAF
jgi:hypothetical protein